MNEGMENLKQLENADIAWQLNRIANSLETIIKMVKQDQEESKKRWEKETIGE